MSRRSRTRGGQRAVVLVVGGLALAGCSAPAAASSGHQGAVQATRIAAPVHAPVWSDNVGVLLALTSDGRIARITPPTSAGVSSSAPTRLSARFAGGGENIATSPTGEHVVYLPEPGRGEVAVVSIASLRQVGAVRDGPEPASVTTDFGSEALIALSADGRRVTGIDLVHDDKVVTSRDVGAGPGADVDAGKRGRRIDYYLSDAEGITYFKGDPSAVQKVGELDLHARTITGDLVKSSRLYVALAGSDRLVAVDEKRSLHGLERVGHADVGAPVVELGVDETRIYAATKDELVVLQTNSFAGYPDGTIPIVERVNFRKALRGTAARDAAVSGLAVGPDKVYLTLRGQPYLLSVSKPSL